MGRYLWPEYLFLTLRLCYWISFIQNPHTCVHSCIMSCTQFYIYKEEQISHGASGRKWWSFSEREARTTKQLEETPSVSEGQPKRQTFPELFLLSADGLKIKLCDKCWHQTVARVKNKRLMWKRGSWMRLFMLQQSRSPLATLPPSFWPLRTKVSIWA